MNPSVEVAMQEAIQNVINQIPTGYVFDSHFVIAQIIKLNSETYLTFIASRFASAATVTAAAVNGQIALVLKKCGNIERMEENGQPLESWSENIHANPNECACWRKM